MKILFSILIAIFFFASTAPYAEAKSSVNKVFVKEYCKKNGVCIKGYWKTKPNRSKTDNYSCKGNKNQKTGKIGKKKC